MARLTYYHVHVCMQLIEIEVVDGASQAIVPLDGSNEEGWKTGYQVRRDNLYMCYIYIYIYIYIFYSYT
jgi:hypothetical protein